MGYYGHIFNVKSSFCWNCGAALTELVEKPWSCGYPVPKEIVKQRRHNQPEDNGQKD
jgi:hypothetical protein